MSVNLDKNDKNNGSVYNVKNLIALIAASGITLAIALALSGEKNGAEPSSVAAEISETSKSISCTIVDAVAIQDINTKPDSRIAVNSDGQSSIIYGRSSQKVSSNYYVYLEDEQGVVIQFSVSDDVYAAMSYKKGDTITVEPKEYIGVSTYYWNGYRLSNPIKVSENTYNDWFQIQYWLKIIDNALKKWYNLRNKLTESDVCDNNEQFRWIRNDIDISFKKWDLLCEKYYPLDDE